MGAPIEIKFNKGYIYTILLNNRIAYDDDTHFKTEEEAREKANKIIDSVCVKEFGKPHDCFEIYIDEVYHIL